MSDNCQRQSGDDSCKYLRLLGDLEYNSRINRKSLLCEIDCKMSDLDNGPLLGIQLKIVQQQDQKINPQAYTIIITHTQ